VTETAVAVAVAVVQLDQVGVPDKAAHDHGSAILCHITRTGIQVDQH
jgi:hypothetical protein